jgi:hypothetical protein
MTAHSSTDADPPDCLDTAYPHLNYITKNTVDCTGIRSIPSVTANPVRDEWETMTGTAICGFLEKEPRQFDLCIIDQISCRNVPEHSVCLANACLYIDRCVFDVIHFQTVSMPSLT